MTSPFATRRADGLSASAGGLLIVALTSATALAATADNPIDYNTARLDRKLPATRAAGPIELDGRLDEPSWLTAPRRQGLHPERPARGRAGDVRHRSADCSTTTTRSTSACSPRTIKPGEIIINELRKDFNTGNSDSFQIVIDTFHDERNGYQFAMNPAGAKWDAQMSNEGRESNSNWDGVWDVADAHRRGRLVRRDPHSVPHAEVRHGIAPDLGHQLPAPSAPLEREQLLVAAAAYPQLVARVDGRHARRSAGPAAGQQPPRQAVRAGQLEPRGNGDNDGDFDAGFDVKYGVTSGLTWDFTVNTDFSQVEADEQQINLTRFSLFFPEKRDFFLENSGHLPVRRRRSRRCGGGGGGGRQNPSQDMILFFSRQIGLSDKRQRHSDSRRHAAHRPRRRVTRSAR